MTTDHIDAPNHHAHYPHFRGLGGLVAGLSMLGRTSDAELVVRLSALQPGDTAVDVGCGPGTAVRHAAHRGASVVGIDPAPVMLRLARALTRARNARFLEGRAEEIPLPDASASVVWSIASVHHWADVDAGLSEILRVLAAGGRFVAVERQTQPGAHGHASHGWTEARAEVFAHICAEHGFLEVSVATHTAGSRRTVSVSARSPATCSK